MAEVINMPHLSDTMTEGVVAAWHKKVGDTVKSGEILADIERQLSRLLRFVNELQIPETRRSQVRERRQINLKNHPRVFRHGNSGKET